MPSAPLAQHPLPLAKGHDKFASGSWVSSFAAAGVGEAECVVAWNAKPVSARAAAMASSREAAGEAGIESLDVRGANSRAGDPKGSVDMAR